MKGLAFILLFVALLALEASFVQTLTGSLSHTPVLLTFGILIAHRYDEYIGTLWVACIGILLHAVGYDQFHSLTYMLSAPFLIILVKRVFATHSLYAVEGLGTIYLVLFFAIEWTLTFFMEGSTSTSSSPLIATWSLLMISLYITFSIAVSLERFSKQFLLQ